MPTLISKPTVITSAGNKPKLIEEFIVDTGDLVLVESTARVASFNKGDCLGFKLDSGVYAIKTYDYANDVVRVIVHRLLPS